VVGGAVDVLGHVVGGEGGSKWDSGKGVGVVIGVDICGVIVGEYLTGWCLLRRFC